MNKKRLLVLGMLGGSDIRYLFRADFDTATAAPLPTPLTVDNGQFDVIDTLSRSSITGGSWVCGAAVATYNPDLTATAGSEVPTVSGTAVKFRAKLNASGRFVAYYKKTGFGQAFIAKHGAELQVASLPSCGPVGDLNWHNYYYIWDTSINYIIGVMDNTFMSAYPAGATYNCLPTIAAYTGGGLFSCDQVRVANLGAPWNQPLTIITSRSTNPSPDATLTMEADARIDYTWNWDHYATPMDCMVRRVDDNNTLIVRLDRTSDTVKLIEKSGGVETEKASASLALGGYYPWIQVLCEGTNIRVWARQVLKINTTSTLNQTATGVKVTNFTAGDMPSGIYCWPRNLSASAVAELQRL